MSFLVSGMPRCRTAWLTALLRAHGVQAYHDLQVRGIDLWNDYLDQPRCVVDPEIALCRPDARAVWDNRPVVCIRDTFIDGRIAALEKATGYKYSAADFRLFANNYYEFEDSVPEEWRIHVDWLDENQVVADVIEYLTGRPASMDTIETFQLLKIEEHMPKAKALRKKL